MDFAISVASSWLKMNGCAFIDFASNILLSDYTSASSLDIEGSRELGGRMDDLWLQSGGQVDLARRLARSSLLNSLAASTLLAVVDDAL